MKILVFLSLLMISNYCVSSTPDVIQVSFLGAETERLSDGIKVLLLLTTLSLAPALLIMVTSFTRIIIVLAMLRHAFGMPNMPPNTVLMGLALFLTIFTMSPVIERIEVESIKPLNEREIQFQEASARAVIPLKEFMIEHTREKDLLLMIDISGKPIPDSISDVDLFTLVPAFLISELHVGFQIGFIIFIPFLLIDLLVASILMAMGMIMVPPMTISLPIKILMFVLIDGWVLIAESLVGSFY